MVPVAEPITCVVLALVMREIAAPTPIAPLVTPVSIIIVLRLMVRYARLIHNAVPGIACMQILLVQPNAVIMPPVTAFAPTIRMATITMLVRSAIVLSSNHVVPEGFAVVAPVVEQE